MPLRLKKNLVFSPFAVKVIRGGPFVYRLGRQVFNLERGVRFP